MCAGALATRVLCALCRGHHAWTSMTERRRPEGRSPVGRNVQRPDGVGKAHGSAMYPADLTSRAALHAVCVRADVACARLDGIDVSAALLVPGVVRVLTAADVRGTNRF